MTAFARQVATAKRLIAKYGATCTFRRLPDAPQDANKPWLVTSQGSAVSYPGIKVCILPYSRINRETQQQIADTEIQFGDFQGLMASQVFVPSLTDVILNGQGLVYRIKKITTLAPDGTDILYTMDLTK